MTQQPTYDSHNPHPLSQMRTELVWEGKYDEYGDRREVDIAGCAMPMQRIEGIDEPRREAIASQQLTLFEQQNPRVDDFRNRLVWGDNKLVMASLLQEFKGKVDLIYIDPLVLARELLSDKGLIFVHKNSKPSAIAPSAAALTLLAFGRSTSTGNPANPSPTTGKIIALGKTAASKPSAMPPINIPQQANTSPASKSSIPLAAIPALQ